MRVSLRSAPDRLSPPAVAAPAAVPARGRIGRSCDCLALFGRFLIWATRNNG